MATKHSSLAWPDRLALIDEYKPSTTAICAAFDVTDAEVRSAMNMASTGILRKSSSFDVAKYGNPFGGDAADVVKQPTVTVHTAPETATKRKKIPQKRGHKGDKIITALRSVPTTPVTVDAFIAQHQVSLAVLRQSKRFLEKMDPAEVQSIGTIHVRQNKDTKALMIWRTV